MEGSVNFQPSCGPRHDLTFHGDDAETDLVSPESPDDLVIKSVRLRSTEKGMNARRKGSKKESGQAFSPWALSLQSSLHSARRLLGLKGPLGNVEIVSDQHSIWIIYPRPNEASIAQRACFDSLLQGHGHG